LLLTDLADTFLEMAKWIFLALGFSSALVIQHLPRWR
jgi:hypothetical protein